VAIGKLYKLGDSEFVVDVNYHVFQHRAAANWWGELTLVDYVSLSEGDMFEIEFEDRRKSKCHLKKKVNRAVSGLPSRYIYHVTGFSPIE
jgi:hypothetical protein